MNQNPITPMIIHPENNGYINSLTPTINGTGEPGTTINTVLNCMNYSTTVNENGTWSINIKEPLQEGATYDISVSQTSPNGTQTATPSVRFRADTQIMTSPAVTSPSGNQFINTPTPTINGTGKAGSTIEATAGSNKYTTMIKQDGSWNIDVNKPLNQGLNTVEIRQIDMGNISDPIQAQFTVDTVAPTQPIISKPMDMGFENTQKPLVSGQGEAGAEVDVSIDNTQYTTTVDANGAWNIEVSEALMDDVHVLSAHQKDPAGNVSPENVLMFTVATQLPQPPIVQSPLNTQTISSSKPAITGLGEPGNTIQVVVNGKTYTGTVGDIGNWELKIADALPDGSYTIQTFQVDKAHNVSVPAEIAIKIDTSQPPMPVVLFPIQNGFANASTFTMKGTGEPEATVNVKVAARELATPVNLDGSWSIDLTLPDKRSYTMTVSQTNTAGSGSQQLELKFKVDANSLKAPSITQPANLGFINTDIPMISGSAYPNATVHITLNGLQNTVTADQSGTWSLNVAENLPQGQNTIQLSQNAMGNFSPEASIFFQVKTTSPSVPVVSYPTQGSQVNDTTMPVRGFAEPNATVEIHLDGMTVSTTADLSGSWMMDIPGALADGVHILLARQTDQAGNSGPSVAVIFQSVSAQAAAAPASGMPITQMNYNPVGPNWTNKVIAVFTSDRPVTIDGVTGTSFSKLIESNGIYSFEYTDSSGTIGHTAAAVSWIDDSPPVIDIIFEGNYFSSDKTIQFYKFGPSGLKCALMNNSSIPTGTKVTAEGRYTVDVCDNAGNTTRKEFVIDKTPPSINGASEDIIYTSDVTLEFQDSVSGIANALLNGNPISSGTTVNSSGDYTLEVYDHGGNMKHLCFKVQK